MPTWKPKFKPGGESCRIQTFNETRARLVAGGSFFRSKDVGAQWNSINLTTVIAAANSGMFNNPSPTTHPNWNPIWSGTGTIVVELRIQHDYTNYLNYYYITQGQVNAVPPPECTVHAPTLLRAQVNSDINTIIEMPVNDVIVPWDSSVDELTTCLISSFSSNMSGGDNGPADPSSVRTGPEKAIIYINQSEKNSPTGVLQDIQELREFNGEYWIPYNPI